MSLMQFCGETKRIFSESYEDDALTEMSIMWFCGESKRVFSKSCELEAYDGNVLRVIL